jgi:hypothetical protein
MQGVKDAVANKGAHAVVVAYSHYGRGASKWLTFKYALGSYSWTFREANTMDKASWVRFEEYLNGQYLSNKKRNTVPFSPLTVWYLPGLDHKVHLSGMGTYKGYFNDVTDGYLRSLTKWLKNNDEFNNKIFIVVADHGHTAMPLPEVMTLPEKDDNGNLIKTWNGEATCELRLDSFGKKKGQYPELANNNLHIWELAEILKTVGQKGWGQYKVAAPKEIADLYMIKDKTTNKIFELPFGATAKIENADIIVGLNGPMAHIYVTDMNKLGKIAELFRLTLDEHPSEAVQWWNVDDLDYSDFKTNIIGKLKKSVDKILVRVSGNYCVFDGLNNDGSVKCAIGDPLAGAEYVDAWIRINGMNHPDRSGDIVFVMRDTMSDGALDRFTTGVACKSWHGSLNASDSYVPFILSYPGGNKTALEKILQKESLCKTDYSNCKGNWKLSDVVKEIILEQYK